MIASAALLLLIQQEPVAIPKLTEGQAARVLAAHRKTGRVGKVMNMRGLHTERSFNYKLRVTWISPECRAANARIEQLRRGLDDVKTAAMLKSEFGPFVFLVELDPREGSGVIPKDWSVHLKPAAGDSVEGRVVDLRDNPVFQGVRPRDYDYDQFWIYFDTNDQLRPELRSFEVTVRIYNDKGRVQFGR